MGDTLISPSGRVALMRVLIGLGGALSAFIFCLFVLPYVLPGSVEKFFVARVLEVALQRPIKISGDAEFSLLPKFQLTATKIIVENKENSDQPVLADIARLHLEAGPWGLLTNTLTVDHLIVDQPVLRLSRDHAGRTNWRLANGGDQSSNLRKPDFNWGRWRDFRIGDVQLNNGRFIFDDRVSGRHINGVNANFRIARSAITGAADGLSLDGDMDVNGEPVHLRIDMGSTKRFLSGGRMPMIAEISANPLTLRYQGTIAKRQYVVTEGQVSVDAVNVNHLESWLGPIFSTAVNGGLRWTSYFSSNANRIVLKDMRLNLGGDQYSGDLRLVAGVKGHFLRGSILADNLNLSSFSNMLPSLWHSNAVDGHLDVNWRKLSYGDLRFGQGRLKVDFSSEDRMTSFDLSRMTLYGGQARARVKISRLGDAYALDAAINVTRVRSGQLFKALRADVPLAGEANVRLKIASVGRNTAQLIAALRGRGGFNVVNGSVSNAVLADHLRVAGQNRLGFSQLFGSFSIDHGVIDGRDLLLKAKHLSLVGDGIVDISQRKVDVHLQSLSRAKGRDNKHGPSIRPIRLIGTLVGFDVVKDEG